MDSKMISRWKDVDFFNYHAVGILEVALTPASTSSGFQTKIDLVENYLKKICTLYAKDTL